MAQVPVWITDASPVTWTDTVELDVETEGLVAGLGKSKYEGLVDEKVFIGNARLRNRPGGLDPEAEWALAFDEPLQTMRPVGPRTECVLVGMIEGKWMAELAQPGRIPWGAASLGNNVLSDGPGVRTTLGAITKKRSAPVATVSVEFRTLRGELRRHYASVKDLEDLPIVDLVRAIQVWCSDKPHIPPLRHVDLGANGARAAYATERMLQVAATVRSIGRAIASLSPKRLTNIADAARAELFSQCVSEGDGIKPGESAFMKVEARKRTVGVAELRID